MGDIPTGLNKSRTTMSLAATSQGMFGTASLPSSEELSDLQGLTLDSSPVKPSTSSQTRSSSSEPSSGGSGSVGGRNAVGSGSGSGNSEMPMFIQQEDIDDMDDDDDEEGGGAAKKGKKGMPNPGRRKIEIEYIEDKVSRHQ